MLRGAASNLYVHKITLGGIKREVRARNQARLAKYAQLDEPNEEIIKGDNLNVITVSYIRKCPLKDDSNTRNAYCYQFCD